MLQLHSLRKRKVKSGCITCKIRKIKCDEDYPACRRCVSTGRVCDGYGIWGGGGNRYEQRSCSGASASVSRIGDASKVQIERAPKISLIRIANAEEHDYFEYFNCRTLPRLADGFGNAFFNTSAFRACAQEPAVLHAALALGSAHRQKEVDSIGRDESLVRPNRREQFMLQHYNKAIDCLQPQSLQVGDTAVRTAMATCLLFVHLEFARGNLKAGCVHFENGLRLSANISLPLDTERTTSRDSSRQSRFTVPEMVDADLKKAFARLQVFIAYARMYSLKHDLPSPSIAYSALPTFKFKCADEARYHLNPIFYSLEHLTTECYRFPDLNACSAGYRKLLHSDKRFTQAALGMWLRTYENTLGEPTLLSVSLEYRILCIYHTMATIMAATCLSHYQQTAYDDHISSFSSIIAQCCALIQTSDRNIRNSFIYNNAKESLNPSRLVSDSGWISPLYYTALKCRDHNLRIQAGKLLGYQQQVCIQPLFTSKIAANVANEVIQIEQAGTCNAMGGCLDEAERSVDMYPCGPSSVPRERRMQKIEVTVPEDEFGNVYLVCKQRVRSEWQSVCKTYDPLQKRWRDSSI